MDSGTGSDLDLAQQESLLANQKAAVPPLRQALDQNANILATLVARPPERVRLTGGSLGALAIPRVTPGIPSDLLTQRPDIRRQENQLASATANVGSARAQFFPSIQLTGQGGYQSAQLAMLFTPQSAFFNVAAGLTQPIFDAGRIQANFDLQQARQDELLPNLSQDRGVGLCRPWIRHSRPSSRPTSGCGSSASWCPPPEGRSNCPNGSFALAQPTSLLC